jgi:hypothetical protein
VLQRWVGATSCHLVRQASDWRCVLAVISGLVICSASSWTLLCVFITAIEIVAAARVDFHQMSTVGILLFAAALSGRFDIHHVSAVGQPGNCLIL